MSNKRLLIFKYLITELTESLLNKELKINNIPFCKTFNTIKPFDLFKLRN